MSKKYVIVGASAASIAVMNKLIRLQPDAQITCITAEKELPYNKCLLADYLAGAKSEQDILLSLSADSRITFKAGISVRSIDINNKTIFCSDDSAISYDSLFLGMGSSPFIPAFMPKKWPSGVFTFHTLSDANRILAYATDNNVSKAIIIGAGLSGVECADVLQKRSIEITIIERQSRILHQFLDQSSADFLVNLIEAGAGKVLCGKTVIAIDEKSSKITGVRLASGEVLACDMLILATGLRPNVGIAKEAGLNTLPSGLLVDQYMQTSMPQIYAGGDLIAVTNTLTGEITASCTWPDAMLQGIHAAHAMADQPKAYSGAAIITSSAFFGLHFAQAGYLEPLQDDQLIVNAGRGYCHRFIVRNGALKGFSVLGNAHNLGVLRRAILTGQPFSPIS